MILLICKNPKTSLVDVIPYQYYPGYVANEGRQTVYPFPSLEDAVARGEDILKEEYSKYTYYTTMNLSNFIELMSAKFKGVL